METHAEEDYLKAIYSISENGPAAVSTKEVAEYINSKPSSVTDMIQRLSAKKLVDYKKYKGFTLTKKGKEKALLIIRKHRLWELFLVEHLNFSWSEVHEVAEQLEHVSSPLLVNRLDAFLNYPVRDPHGDIIPDINGNLRDDDTIVLTEVPNKKTCFVTWIKDSSSEFLTYLDQVNIGLDTEIKILESYPYDRSIKVKIPRKSAITLSEKVCKNLYVRLNEN
ncbi:MAG TPA: metal-dependent transcriptional regulator [Bacteroidetes bacterium]|nr:metal-dependent transcriptional regulator [Bacteroidota bacterium]